MNTHERIISFLLSGISQDSLIHILFWYSLNLQEKVFYGLSDRTITTFWFFSLIKAAHFYICIQLVDDICPNNKIKYKLQY